MCHSATALPPARRPHRAAAESRSAPAAPSRAPSVRFAHLHSKATAPAARRRAPAEAAHGTQLEGPNCAVPQKRPRKIKCPYACLRIRWHGSPCRPAVREVVHQLSVQGLRVRGSRAGFRSCAASAPGAAALPAAHASVKPALSPWRAPSASGAAVVRNFAVVLPFRRHLNVFLFAPVGEMPLWKRKEAKEKGLSEPDSLWS